MNPSFPDLRGKHRPEPVRPEANRLVANVDAALEQQVLYLSHRQRIADVQHHRQAYDLRRAAEIAERSLHPSRLENGLLCLKPFCSDTALNFL